MWPDRERVAAFTRKLVEDYAHWDSPAAFYVVAMQDGELVPRCAAALAMPPEAMPMVIAATCAQDAEAHPENPACAYALQLETWAAPSPAPGASEEEIRKFLADGAAGRFHTRDDRIEQAQAFCASVPRGDLWRAVQTRDKGGVTEEFVDGGNAAALGNAAGAILALVQVARTTGQHFWPSNLTRRRCERGTSQEACHPKRWPGCLPEGRRAGSDGPGRHRRAIRRGSRAGDHG
jgi:hypothetical protein